MLQTGVVAPAEMEAARTRWLNMLRVSRGLSQPSRRIGSIENRCFTEADAAGQGVGASHTQTAVAADPGPSHRG